MKKISENILSWCDRPEQGAIEQAMNIAKHPCLVGNVCLMPDTHQGYGMPIGGVAALDNAICPNMVGVDIGCGMLAVKTSLTEISQDDLKKILERIRQTIPVGFKKHGTYVENSLFESEQWSHTPVCNREIDNARLSLGTLGGGNHFIEIQKGDDDHIWFMIHSGSRNLGKQVAEHYNEIAEILCDRYKQLDVIKTELAFLPAKEPAGKIYIEEMSLCLQFAYENRQEMARKIAYAFKQVCNADILLQHNIHHNYAALESHYGRNVWVHRKGATSAKKGEIGIIPGSQGTCSYIVVGLGNKASLMSCSHGAGRAMSRKKARETLSVESETARLNDIGVLHAIRSVDDLDEAPSAYKDIDVVMEEQKDLVEVLVKLTPLAVIKG